MELTSIERASAFLKREPHDRVPTYERWWRDTRKEWFKRGWIDKDCDFINHFDHDFRVSGFLNTVADLDFEDEIIAEDENSITTLDGNGAILKRNKHHEATPEHINFTVTDKKSWNDKLRDKLTADLDTRRIDYENYRKSKRLAKENDQFFMASTVNVFEMMHPICGHEHMLVGMALEPDWIKDMCEVLSNLFINSATDLFYKEGIPDGMFFSEDMGFKGYPFMSPAMYKELIQPFHKKTIDFIKSYGIPVIMHSCGFVEPLLPYMIESGIDCLHAIEVKAGMDLLKLVDSFGEKLSFMGGMDIRQLYTNDKNTVKKELESKLPMTMKYNGYALHSDHSIPQTVDYDTYKYFLEYGKKLGTY